MKYYKKELDVSVVKNDTCQICKNKIKNPHWLYTDGEFITDGDNEIFYEKTNDGGRIAFPVGKDCIKKIINNKTYQGETNDF